MFPPRATYRLQFTPAFGFDDAAARVPYFARLGISHLYASPIFAAGAGSTHGYDVVDHAQINPELGGEAGFGRLAAAARAAGLGIILDIVPNHMGVADPANRAWLDLLEFGPNAPSAPFFDIDWERAPVLVPILDGALSAALRDGLLRPDADPSRGRVGIALHERWLPLRPRSVARLMAIVAERLDHGAWQDAIEPWRRTEQYRLSHAELGAARRLMSDALSDADGVAALLDLLRATLADPERALGLLDEQHWRLTHWRTSRDVLNYRRFFNIVDLAALRVEEPAVFDIVHNLPLRLVREGLVDGLRIDHVDGLADPAAYCERLRRAVGPEITLHLEKILGAGERLRPWPVDGTTGYETINLINGLFIDPEGYGDLRRDARAEGIVSGGVRERVVIAKRRALLDIFVAELDQLTRIAKRIADQDIDARDFTHESLKRALTELIVWFPVYRSYLTSGPPDPADTVLVNDAMALASVHADPWQLATLEFLRARLTNGEPGAARELRSRFQQLTAPVMAKGYEDTELYRHVLLLSSNEVGGNIADPVTPPARFHAAAADLAERAPLSLTPLSTHDTKRGAGARARIDLLSERPAAWRAAVREWAELNAGLQTALRGARVPDEIDQEMIYQTLLGVWPVEPARLTQYLNKAFREARRRSSWDSPDQDYEAAITGFATALIDGAEGAPFRASFARFIAPMIAAGRINELAQTIIQLTMPGVPDIYWGTEFWDHALVDPDNRRPVDWRRREKALGQSVQGWTQAEIGGDDEGVTKQAAILALLDFRRRRPDIFAGGYRALEAIGSEAEAARWLLYAREAGAAGLIVAAPLRGLAMVEHPIGPDLRIAIPAPWRGAAVDLLSGQTIDLPQEASLRDMLGGRVAAVFACGAWALDGHPTAAAPRAGRSRSTA